MKIINVNSSDTGGQCYRLSKFINEKFPEHNSRAFVRAKNYIDYNADVLFDPAWSKGVPEWIKTYWSEADVLHCHNKWRNCNGWASLNPNVARVIHQHGRYPSAITKPVIWKSDASVKAIRVVSTLNLAGYVKDFEPKRWFPTPIEVNLLKSFKRKHYLKDDIIRVFHSPTQRHLKHTDLFLKCMKKILAKHKNVELHMCENKSWNETQALRAKCDICYDQLLLQHGSNALESMAMGMPVIAGAIRNPGILDLIESIVGYLPFYNADESSLFATLEDLILNESVRKEYSTKGYEYVQKWHTEDYVTKLAIGTYKEALELRK